MSEKESEVKHMDLITLLPKQCSLIHLRKKSNDLVVSWKTARVVIQQQMYECYASTGVWQRARVVNDMKLESHFIMEYACPHEWITASNEVASEFCPLGLADRDLYWAKPISPSSDFEFPLVSFLIFPKTNLLRVVVAPVRVATKI